MDFEEDVELAAAAEQEGPLARLVALLGENAGRRSEEIMALERHDVDLSKRQLTVWQSEWRGHLTVPKSGKPRHEPLTARLAEALREFRHLRGTRVWMPSARQLPDHLVGY